MVETSSAGLERVHLKSNHRGFPGWREYLETGACAQSHEAIDPFVSTAVRQNCLIHLNHGVPIWQSGSSKPQTTRIGRRQFALSAQQRTAPARAH